MAAPSTTDIENLYQTAENAGLTRTQVDQIAIPMIRTIGTVRSLRDVRSHRELRAIAETVNDATRKAAPVTVPTVDATPRQINRGRAAGHRLGVNGEVWDD